MKKFITIGVFILLSHLVLQAQNQANTWYFCYKNGLDFNSGEPVLLNNCPNPVWRTACISDTNGNLLFFEDSRNIYNKDLEIMQGGEGLLGGFDTKQPTVIVPHPGNTNLYYVFTVGSYHAPYGLLYSIVNISTNNGNGSVIEKNVAVANGTWARHRVTAVRHSNNIDWWIITRFYQANEPGRYACFLLTSNGVNPIPVISPATELLNSQKEGNLKVSHDKKKLISVR